MVALRTERRVYLWHAIPQPNPVDANKPVTLAEIINILQTEKDGGRARVYLSEGGSRFLEDDDSNKDEGNQLYIADIKWDNKNQTATLLLNRGDPNAVSTAYLAPAKNTVRVDPPKPGESPGWSAHLVISTTLKNKRHQACFEKMPRVSSHLVLSALDRFVSRAVSGNPAYRYEVSVKTKNKIGTKQRPYRPTLSITRVPSERLVDDLENGELAGVTVTKKTDFYTGVGKADLVKYQEQKITIKTAPSEPKKVKNFLAELIEKAKNEGYTEVTFHLDKLPKGQTNNPTVPLDDHDALEHLYSRARIIDGFGSFLEAVYPNICPEIEAKMAAVVKDKW